jgi:gamma-tubulin complex component 5
MSLHFSDVFVAFAGDTTTTLDISRQSIPMKRHPSRRQKRQRRNVIGFSQSMRDATDSSEDDDVHFDERDMDGGLQPPEPSFSMAASSTSSAEDGFYSRIDKMSSELDGLVRFVRRGVESLAGGTGEAAPAFGIFAFALEDWDN